VWSVGETGGLAMRNSKRCQKQGVWQALMILGAYALQNL